MRIPKKRQKKIASKIVDKKAFCPHTDTPEQMEILDDYEWIDNMSEFIDNINHSDIEDIQIMPDDLDLIEDD